MTWGRGPGVLALAALAATACLDRFEPDVGEPLRPLCRDEDSDAEVDVSYRDDIQPIFTGDDYRCTECHTSGGETPIGVRVSGLSLGSRDSLLRGGIEGGDQTVVPGRPCDSILLQKVGEAPPFGARMPLDGPPFLTLSDRQLIADWIAEGADDD